MLVMSKSKLKKLARDFHEKCNTLELNYAANRKTKKRLARLKYNIKFELEWQQAIGHIDHGYTEEQVAQACLKYRRRYEK